MSTGEVFHSPHPKCLHIFNNESVCILYLLFIYLFICKSFVVLAYVNVTPVGLVTFVHVIVYVWTAVRSVRRETWWPAAGTLGKGILLLITVKFSAVEMFLQTHIRKAHNMEVLEFFFFFLEHFNYPTNQSREIGCHSCHFLHWTAWKKKKKELLCYIN